MLLSSAVEKNLELATDYVTRGLELKPVTGSLLEQLVNTSLPPSDIKDISPEALSILIEAVTANIDNVSSHSTCSDNAVELLSNAVTSHIKVAKETILPIVKDVTDKVIDRLNSYKLYDAATDINIKMYKKSHLLNDDIFLELISNYKGTEAIAPSFMNLGPKLKQEILLLCTIGSSSFDNDILEWVSSLDEEIVVNVYNALFNYEESAFSMIELTKTINSFDVFNKATLGFLIAKRLYDQVDEQAKNMTLAAYQQNVGAIRDYCASLVVRSIDDIETANKVERLILRLDRTSKTIEVNDAIYKKWLETNTEEAILGTLVADRAPSSLELLLQQKDQLAKQWTNYKTYLTLRKEQDNNINIKNFMVSVIYDQLKDTLTDIEIDYSKINNNHIETVKTKAEEFVNDLTTNDMDNIPEVCLALVTKSRFYFTNAYDILNGMCEVEKINPDIDPREAALISVLYYITDYFIDQVRVEKIA